MLHPRDYQSAALEAVDTDAAAGLQRLVVALPTGAGKTPVAVWAAKKRGGRTLLLTHRDELIQQAEEKFKVCWPEAAVGIVKAERDERDKQVVLASVQTVASKRRALAAEFNTIIVDEMHHSIADSWQAALAAAGAYLPGVLTLGFSATPERGDKRALGSFWQKISYSRTILQMIQAGWLSDLRAKQVSLAVDLGVVKIRNGDYADGSLGDAMHAAGAPAKVAEAWVRYGEGRRTLCYAPTVAIAQEIEQELRDRGVRSACVWGEQALDARRAVLAAYAEGKFQVLTNCAVLLEGYDDPATSCILMARPTKSRVLYQQAIGRGTRTFPEKADCLILDMVGASVEHDLCTLATLLGVTEASAERGVVDTIRRAQEGAAVEGELTAADVKLFDRAKLHWIVDGRRFLLAAGDCTLALQQEGLSWTVTSIPRDWKAQKQVLARDLTMAYGQGFCEDWVREHGGMALARASADWRKRPASEYPKMERVLRKWGKWREGILAGEASDLISLGIVRKRA